MPDLGEWQSSGGGAGEVSQAELDAEAAARAAHEALDDAAHGGLASQAEHAALLAELDAEEAARAAADAALQPLDADLTALAALATTAQGRALLDDASAADQLSTLGVSAFVKTILDDANAAAALATLGAQAQDADLDAIAALSTTAAGRALLDDADASAQLTTLGMSTFFKTLIDDADAAAVRATLGIGASIATAESLRFVRGRVAGNGAIVEGAGFTVNRVAAGEYDITCDPAFSDIPAMVATPEGNHFTPRTRFHENSGAVFEFNGGDTAFGFFAVGPA